MFLLIPNIIPGWWRKKENKGVLTRTDYKINFCFSDSIENSVLAAEIVIWVSQSQKTDNSMVS